MLPCLQPICVSANGLFTTFVLDNLFPVCLVGGFVINKKIKSINIKAWSLIEIKQLGCKPGIPPVFEGCTLFCLARKCLRKPQKSVLYCVLRDFSEKPQTLFCDFPYSDLLFLFFQKLQWKFVDCSRIFSSVHPPADTSIRKVSKAKHQKSV